MTTNTTPGLRRRSASGLRGYLLVEALAYIGVVFVVLGVGYAAMYKCVDNSVALRRSAEDFTGAMHAGERWRSDVRNAGKVIQVEETSDGRMVRFEGINTKVTYRFAEGAVYRQENAGGWARLVSNVRGSTMEVDKRQQVTAWRWNLELNTRVRNSKIRPLFTFEAVPGKETRP